MALRRYTTSVDGSIPVQALLYNDEEFLSSQDGVGIYDGSQKSPDHPNGTVSVTTHRLFYTDAQKAVSKSFVLDLSYINQTEYYAGLFKSSPKVTCHLSGEPISSPNESGAQFESWECEVCAYRNPPGLSPAAAKICGLCGVPRSSTPRPISPLASSSPYHLSSSLPSSSISLSASLAAESNHTGGRKQTEIPCTVCTFLNHHLLRECEMCGAELPKPKAELQSAPSSRPLTPDPDTDGTSNNNMIKLSFRKGGDKPFYTVLKSSLKSKAWEGSRTHTPSLTLASSSGADNRSTTTTPGISGILRTVESTTQEREMNMKSALQDMEALMLKAKDMVNLAAELNEKLTTITSSNTNTNNTYLSPSWSPTHHLSAEEPEDATFVRSSLSQLGLQISNAPVTIDMMKDEEKWLEELAKELGRVLQGSFKPNGVGSGGMMKDRGIIALDEVWGGWNRSRGVALIPPSTFLQVIPLLPTYTDPPIHQRTFSSGLNVLHTPPYAHTSFASRLSNHLRSNGPKTTLEIADEEKELPVGLVAEMVEEVEEDGWICRDDGGAAIVGGSYGIGTEIRWWNNVFVGYRWDGQE